MTSPAGARRRAAAPSRPDAGHAPSPWLAIAGVVLVAINLRPALAGVGPLVDAIRADTGLSNTALGLLTTLPLLAFGAISNFTSVVTRRWGIERALAAALLLVAVGTALRGAAPIALLFGGTLLLGVGIALGNVLLPALVKRDFPARSGPMTSLYSSVMALGATVAAGVSVPIAAAVGWRGALAVWALPALAALVGWLPRVVGASAGRATRSGGLAPGALLRSRLAWQVALFMGLQSLTFYVVLAWLPALLVSRGLAADEAGWLLALSQATGILGSAIVPVWAGRRADHRGIVWLLAALEGVALAGLLAPGVALAPLWVGLLGAVLGGTFGLSLLFLVVRASDVATATALSGIAQAVGYLVAAAGPALFGLLRDVTQGWTVPLLSLVVVLAGKVVVGRGAGWPGVVRAAGAAAS